MTWLWFSLCEKENDLCYNIVAIEHQAIFQTEKHPYNMNYASCYPTAVLAHCYSTSV